MHELEHMASHGGESAGSASARVLTKQGTLDRMKAKLRSDNKTLDWVAQNAKIKDRCSSERGDGFKVTHSGEVPVNIYPNERFRKNPSIAEQRSYRWWWKQTSRGEARLRHLFPAP